MDTVRTRFAPSPTGFMHVGNLRTALYEYLIAKVNGGKFILRIEDTDQERFVEGAMDVVLKTLNDSGIKFDEGPGIGGEYGPYIQSERKAIYKEYALKLVESGHAYYCFCTKERLDSLKSSDDKLGASFNYDRHCLTLSKEEIQRNLDSGMPYVIRQYVPHEGTTTFHDVVYGDITVENKTLDDQILLKSDGLPTYNFANIVDDHLMHITHVVRGNEYLASTPKYNLIYEAFGWEPPVYIHLSPVMKDSQHKLSKRDGDASFHDLVARGYLPEAILNYIALLGWSPRGNEEFFTINELEKVFHIDGISKSPSLFDINKLTWMNGEYIRRMSVEEFTAIATPYIKQVVPGDVDYTLIAGLIQPRTELLCDIPGKVDFIGALPDYDTALYCHKKMKTDEAISLESLKILYKFFIENKHLEWISQSLYEKLCELASESGIKNSQILWPLRTALSGKEVSPGGATELAQLLGYTETINRIKIGIDKLEAKVNGK